VFGIWCITVALSKKINHCYTKDFSLLMLFLTMVPVCWRQGCLCACSRLERHCLRWWDPWATGIWIDHGSRCCTDKIDCWYVELPFKLLAFSWVYLFNPLCCYCICVIFVGFFMVYFFLQIYLCLALSQETKFSREATSLSMKICLVKFYLISLWIEFVEPSLWLENLSHVP
jgi:hypothetical protein